MQWMPMAGPHSVWSGARCERRLVAVEDNALLRHVRPRARDAGAQLHEPGAGQRRRAVQR